MCVCVRSEETKLQRELSTGRKEPSLVERNSRDIFDKISWSSISCPVCELQIKLVGQLESQTVLSL